MHLPIQTPRGIRRLAREAAEGRRIIVAAVVDAVTEQNGRHYWGQFLDYPRRSQQHGIYAACAAIEILIANGYAPQHELIAGTAAALPIVGDGAGYDDPADLGLVFKVAALTSAACCINPALSVDDEPVSALIAMAVDDRGWGNYAFVSGGPRDAVPQLVPTAVAMLALERVTAWRSHNRCRTTLVWILSQVSPGATTDLESALSLLALVVYQNPGIEIDNWRSSVGAVRDHVRDVVGVHQSSPIVARYHYPVSLPAGPDANHYMFFLPSVIAAIGLLRFTITNGDVGLLDVLRVVREASIRCLHEKGFRAPDHHALATLDQLWVDRLLRHFIELARTPNKLLPPLLRPFRSRRAQASGAIALTAIAIAAGVFASSTGPAGWLRAVAGLLAAFAVALLAGAIRLFRGD